MFLTIKLRTYAKLNCLKWNCFDIETVSKVGDPSRGRPEGSLFNSYNTKV